jgi:bifunctional non-homologous end joining protein LigD
MEEAPAGDDWSHEVKFDGYRALVRIEDGAVEIRSRNDKDWTIPYQTLAAAAARLPVRRAILDGEVVAQSPDGTTSFEALRHLARVPTASPGASAGAEDTRAATRLVYYAFDLLFLDDFELLDVPLAERRSLLERVLADTQADVGERIRFSQHLAGDGPIVLRQACSLGLEGVVSKKMSSRYRPGVRAPEWVKTKCRHEQEFVIGGFTDPSGSRVGFGALLLGVYDERGLRYVSRVGTGFDETLLRDLGARLRALEVEDPPFATGLPKQQEGVHWVRPDLVAQVSFLEWTSTGSIRHPSFLGLREDKPPLTVKAEEPAPRVVVGTPAGTPSSGGGRPHGR